MSLLIGLMLALQNINPTPPVMPPSYGQLRAMRIPVIAGDINDRPYRVIAEIKTDVRKWTVFEKNPSEAKVYRELWERARKLGADAVVNAKYSETLYGGLTWGRRHASGQAIEFLSDAEIASRQTQSSPVSSSSVEVPPDATALLPKTAPQAQIPTSRKKRPPITCLTCN